MMEHPRLLAVLAHPDDESRIIGGTLAKYASEGVWVVVWLATRGEASTLLGDPPICTPAKLAEVRARELAAAAEALGLTEVRVRDYPDGGLDDVGAARVVGDIVRTIREVRPQVMITFGPEGRTLHPDHIAIHRFATRAFELAGDPEVSPEQLATCMYEVASNGKQGTGQTALPWVWPTVAQPWSAMARLGPPQPALDAGHSCWAAAVGTPQTLLHDGGREPGTCHELALPGHAGRGHHGDNRRVALPPGQAAGDDRGAPHSVLRSAFLEPRRGGSLAGAQPRGFRPRLLPPAGASGARSGPV